MGRSISGRRFGKSGIRRRLLGWYERAKRDLPWRRTSDPYRIWLSEVMLQQTRVEAVKPYYENFLSRFPSVRALADGPEEKVLAAWSGLGYYSRGKNLRRAARLIVDRHHGQFPRDEASALELPGVGRYTAAAVLSIAYGVPLAVLDGNVARVLSRILAINADVRDSKGRVVLWNHAQELLDPKSPGDFNQAMMELGATVCLPAKPVCEECPLAVDCSAHEFGKEAYFPPARKHAQGRTLQLVAAIVRDAVGRYLLERRNEDSPWMAGFWQIPTWEPASRRTSQQSHESELQEQLTTGRSLGILRHSITKYRIQVNVKEAELAATRAFRTSGPSVLWAAYSDLKRLPVTTITRKAIQLTQAKSSEAR
jgi:A/G-specific adenine glycosylase